MTSALEAQVEDLGRASRRSAIQSVVGLGALLSSLAIAAWRLTGAEQDLRAIEAQVLKLEAERTRLETTKSNLESETQNLSTQKRELEHSNRNLEEEVQRLRGPLPTLVQLKSSSELLPGVRDPEGRQIHDFSLWVELPEFRKAEIKNVTYTFDHPSAIKKQRVARLPANGFSISYRGWGCFRRIVVSFDLKDGSSFRQEFDQCRALGW